MTTSKNFSKFDKKWKNTFKLGKSGEAAHNAIAIEIEGVKYDSLVHASEQTGKSIWWCKKHGKKLK